MGIAAERDGHMDRRALLTEREREVLSGDADDVEDLAQYQSKVRTRLKGRLDRLEEDIELLDDHEPEIAADLHERVCGEEDTRLAKLEREVAELRDRISEDS
ncbi:hypothetical protein [Halobacterium salinarum]|uniref:hypothetical protein n=1 Tax=Halobacterium salinarum TaxID=2242 RepID=UPI001F427040|nr:hypothetical protein [Halobacterium salinarum]MCF2165418.1 hypothetical protein [Halobacterium salinarum]MCF2168326.1 hypothetical protein [Halobacterium salinarum]